MTAKKRQLNIFGQSLNPVSRLKAAMRQAIKDGRYSREQVVERMNQAAAAEGLNGGRGHRLTVAALDGWLAETKGNMIPVGLLPCFVGRRRACCLCGCWRIAWRRT